MDQSNDSDTVRQHNHDRIRQQVRRNSFSPSPDHCPEDLGLLFEDEHTPPVELCSISIQSGGRTVETPDITTRVADIPDIFPTAGEEVGSSFDRHVRQSLEPSDSTVCVLETGTNSLGNGCNVPQLESPRPPLSLPSMEPSRTGDSQTSTRTNISDFDHAMVAHSNLVSGPEEPSPTTPTPNSSLDGPSSSRLRRKRPARESALVVDRMEHKIRRLEEAGADPNVTNTIMQANPRRYLRYAQVQAKFMGWCRDNSANHENPASVLNFLAHGRTQLGWSLQTLMNYRSSIADMFPDRASILDFWPLQTFFQAVQDTTIRNIQSRPADIQPIIEHFHHLGPNHSMSLGDLTAKTCWLLGVCGFMRPSDIERIDMDKSTCTDIRDRIVFTVVAPKEKRLGQRVMKEVIIRSHSDPLLCPVATVRSYLARHAHRPCHLPHPALPHVTINYFIRDLRDCHRPVYAQRISNHIKSIMSLLPSSGGRPLRARALGSTRALLAGANLDAVITHGHWSSQAIFDNFYRLSSDTLTDFTSLVLNTPVHEPTLEQQSQDPPNEV